MTHWQYKSRQSKRANLSGLLLALAVVLALGGILLGQTWSEWRDWQRLEREGTAIRVAIGSRQQSRKGRHVVYTFNAPERDWPVERLEEVDGYLYARLPPGTTVEVYYWPPDPYVARIKGNYYERNLSTTFCSGWGLCSFQFMLLILLTVRPPSSQAARRVFYSALAAGFAGLLCGYLTMLAESILKIHWLDGQISGLLGLLVGAAVAVGVLGYVYYASGDPKTALTWLWRKLGR